MSFLAPIAFLGALIAIPILLLYMLRLRRREVIVSSNFLWQQIVHDKEANTPWQRLRRNLLLFLQLIILALLVMALARPFVTVPTVSAGKTALLIDASASMNATDVDGKTRFEAAKDKARELIGQMGTNDSLSLIRVANVAEPLTPYTNDIQQLRGALNDLQASRGPADWDTALILAAGGAAGAENFNVVIISDGGINASSQLGASIPEPIYIPVGTSGDNLALSALAVDRLPGQTPQLFAQVVNYGQADAEISLVVKLDGVANISRTETLTARSQRDFVFNLDQPFTTVEAEVVLRDETTTDYLALDNAGWATTGGGGTRRILLLSEPNIFIEQILRSLPGVQLFQGDITRASLPNQAYDLYVFNNYLPQTLPDGDMLIIGPPRGTALFTQGTETQATANKTILRPDDPRMTFVDFDAVNIRAFKPITASWADTLIQADGGPLLVAGESDGHQIAILTFDIRDSDLPLQITWPVLMSNLLQWFTPADIITTGEGLIVGDSVVIQVPPDAHRLQVRLPDGTTHDMTITGDTAIFADTALSGLYLLDVLKDEEVIRTEPFAVNLFGTGESNIAPVPQSDIRFGGNTVSAETDEELGQREYWPIAALLALAILLIEWTVYHRRLQVPTVMLPVTRRRPIEARS